jgi:hypothetical protein
VYFKLQSLRGGNVGADVLGDSVDGGPRVGYCS